MSPFLPNVSAPKELIARSINKHQSWDLWYRIPMGTVSVGLRAQHLPFIWDLTKEYIWHCNTISTPHIHVSKHVKLKPFMKWPESFLCLMHLHVFLLFHFFINVDGKPSYWFCDLINGLQITVLKTIMVATLSCVSESS